jgi:RNA polymerase sigma factor (sigma-70 family)
MKAAQPGRIFQDDAVLVRTIQENGAAGWCPAATLLWQRHNDWIDGLLARLARQHRLSVADLEDAGQDAVFGFLRAVDRFDTVQATRTDLCSFRTFLYRVLTNQVTDALRRRRRERSLRQPAPPTRPTGVERLLADDGNPADAAEEHELQTRLWQIREHLGSDEAELLDGLMSGQPLRAIAVSLGVSYDATKRRWRKLRRHLSVRLRDWKMDDGEIFPNSPPHFAFLNG